MGEKEDTGQLVTVRIKSRSYQLLLTLQSLKQLEEKKRITISKVLNDVLEREVERIEKEKGGIT